MKILFLANFLDIHSEKWAQYYINKGHSVVKVHSDSFSLRTIWNLRKIIKRFKPDVLSSHYAGAWGLMGTLTFFHPHIVTVHGSEVHFTKGLKKLLVTWILKRADIVTSDGEHTINKIFKLTKDKANGKTVLIRFGVEVDRFRNIHVPIAEKIIISLRNHEPVYDVGTLLKAVPLIIDKIPDMKFRIAGSGSLTEKLKEEAKTLNIEKYVRFQPLRSADQVCEALNQATLYVSTALADAGIAASTAEAMACELPVLVTDVAENRKWVARGNKEDQLFKPCDYRDLAEKAVFLIKNDIMAMEYGKANRVVICALNNYDREMNLMEHYLKEACNV